MDYISASVALDIIARALETDVMTRVEDSYTRSQLWASTGILANIAVELRAQGQTDTAWPDDAAVINEGRDFGAAAEQLLTRVRDDVTQQVSLHYKKAASGARP